MRQRGPRRLGYAHRAQDLGGQALLAEVVETMTQLAGITTNFAARFIHQQLATQFGEPLDAQGQAQRLLIVGMGKLGGRELNVSSDVDYIFIYPEDGEPRGRLKADGNRRYLARLGKRLIAVLNEVTSDGQVFRVDMRLRPYGDSKITCSSSLENYCSRKVMNGSATLSGSRRVMNDER